MKLDVKLRKNLIALEFISRNEFSSLQDAIDVFPSKFKKNLIKKTIESTHHFYSSIFKLKSSNIFISTQKEILLLLIGVFIIQFKSKKGTKNKFSEYIEYMFTYLGRFFQIESIIALYYFLDPNNIKFFEVINKGGKPKDLIAKLENMSWDMASIRFLEKYINIESDDCYLVPYFLSMDENLLDLYKFYKLKGIIIDKNTNIVIPIPNDDNDKLFNEYMTNENLDKYFSSNSRKNRMENNKLIGIDMAIKKQLKVLSELFVS